MITNSGGSLSVNNSTIAYSSSEGIYSSSSSPVIANTQFLNNDGNALYISAGDNFITPTIQNNSFVDNGG